MTKILVWLIALSLVGIVSTVVLLFKFVWGLL